MHDFTKKKPFALINILKNLMGVMVHTWNSSYSGGLDRRVTSLRQLSETLSQTKINIKRADFAALVVGQLFNILLNVKH